MTLPGGDETVSRWLQNAMGMSQCLGKDRSRCIAGCIEVSVGRTRMWRSLLLVRIATRQALQMLGERVNKSHTPSKAAREREREAGREGGRECEARIKSFALWLALGRPDRNPSKSSGRIYRLVDCDDPAGFLNLWFLTGSEKVEEDLCIFCPSLRHALRLLIFG